jgi:hypothetical protein
VALSSSRPQNLLLVSGPMRLLSSAYATATRVIPAADCSTPNVSGPARSAPGVAVAGGYACLVGREGPEPVDTVTQVRARTGGTP